MLLKRTVLACTVRLSGINFLLCAFWPHLLSERHLSIPGEGVYKGDVLDNTTRTGSGKLWGLGGDVYEGEWRENRKHGTGRHSLPDGAVYEGEFDYDRRHGHGRLFYPNGDLYDGDWIEDNKHGRGRFVWSATGVTYEGEFHVGVIQGRGVMRYPDGSTFEGQYHDAKRHGKGVLSHADGTKECLVFKKGAKDKSFGAGPSFLQPTTAAKERVDPSAVELRSLKSDPDSPKRRAG